jgi:hypothetical protein
VLATGASVVVDVMVCMDVDVELLPQPPKASATTDAHVTKRNRGRSMSATSITRRADSAVKAAEI